MSRYQTSHSLYLYRIVVSDRWRLEETRKSCSILGKIIDDERIIGTLSLKSLITWIDMNYAVYNNIRSYTDGSISMDWSLIQGRSLNQKINSKSYTETEVVGVSEYMTFNL